MNMRICTNLDIQGNYYELSLERFRQRYMGIPALALFNITLIVSNDGKLIRRVDKQFTSYKKALYEFDRLCKGPDMGG